MKLGCSRCRYSKKGCKTCKAKVDLPPVQVSTSTRIDTDFKQGFHTCRDAQRCPRALSVRSIPSTWERLSKLYQPVHAWMSVYDKA